MIGESETPRSQDGGFDGWWIVDRGDCPVVLEAVQTECSMRYAVISAATRVELQYENGGPDFLSIHWAAAWRTSSDGKSPAHLPLTDVRSFFSTSVTGRSVFALAVVIVNEAQ